MRCLGLAFLLCFRILCEAQNQEVLRQYSKLTSPDFRLNANGETTELNLAKSMLYPIQSDTTEKNLNDSSQIWAHTFIAITSNSFVSIPLSEYKKTNEESSVCFDIKEKDETETKLPGEEKAYYVCQYFPNQNYIVVRAFGKKFYQEVIELKDASGKIIFKEKLNICTATIRISTQNLVDGNYLLNAFVGNDLQLNRNISIAK